MYQVSVKLQWCRYHVCKINHPRKSGVILLLNKQTNKLAGIAEPPPVAAKPLPLPARVPPTASYGMMEPKLHRILSGVHMAGKSRQTCLLKDEQNKANIIHFSHHYTWED